MVIFNSELGNCFDFLLFGHHWLYWSMLNSLLEKNMNCDFLESLQKVWSLFHWAMYNVLCFHLSYLKHRIHLWNQWCSFSKMYKFLCTNSLLLPIMKYYEGEASCFPLYLSMLWPWIFWNEVYFMYMKMRLMFMELSINLDLILIKV